MVELGTFGDFWDTIGLIVNGNIFFFSGASAINFFWRSTEASILLIKGSKVALHAAQLASKAAGLQQKRRHGSGC